MITAIMVGFGGMAGALMRFALDQAFEARRARRRPAVPPKPPFPAGTLLVNTLGSLLIGLAWGLMEDPAAGPGWYAACAAGFAGGLTTFSTLTVAGVSLWRGRRAGAAVVHLAANLALGLGAASLGLVISDTI